MKRPKTSPEPSIRLLPWVMLACLVVLVVLLCIFHE